MRAQLAVDLALVRALCRRELLRLGRQPARILGALGQPVIFWVVIGSGMASTFRLGEAGPSYPEYFFPGVVLMVALFASIFASVGVIEERQRGFLQAVEAGPASALGIALGKSLAAAGVAAAQMAGFLLLAPLANFSPAAIAWADLGLALGAACLAFSAAGLALAWRQTSVQVLHAVQMLVMVPLWVASGAMFPLPTGDGLAARLTALNPLAYLLAAVRHALYGGRAPADVPCVAGPGLALGVALALTAISLGLAAWACRRRG